MDQKRVGVRLIHSDGEAYVADAACPLTVAQLNDVSKLLDQRIAGSEFAAIPARAAGLMRRVSASDQFREAGIAVDVQLGSVVLCLFAPDWLTSKIGAPNLRNLAELFVQRVREVYRARQRHMDRFARASRMIDAAIERSSTGMALVSLKTAPQRVDANLTDCRLELEATVSMLNDALEPYTQRILAWTPRDLVSSISHYGPNQRKHLRASARLQASSAVLEIDALAERAIALAGADLAGCVRALQTSCDSQNGLGQALILNEDAVGRTSVYLRSGRIMASVWLFKVGLVYGREFMIDRLFPDTVRDSLVKCAATTIIDLPLLRDIRIESAQRRGDTQTLVRLRTPKRFIRAAELDETVRLAA